MSQQQSQTPLQLRATREGRRPGGGLGPDERVRSRSDFSALFRGGRRGGDDVVRVIVAKNGRPEARIAAAVQKRFGCAVRRNKLRRLYKEAFRLEKERMPAGYDVVCSPPRGTGIPELAQLRESLVKVVTKTVARLEERRGRKKHRGKGARG
jgi:ribonuclease P protein component